MTRRPAIVAAGIAAAAVLAGVWLLTSAVNHQRFREREQNQRATHQQRLASLGARPSGPSTAKTRMLCVRGVETLATALLRAHPRRIVSPDGTLDLPALAALSNAAVAAERYAEAAAAGPALPQRLGRAKDASGAWHPLRPRPLTCNGSDAYAAVRVPTAPDGR